MSEQDLVIEEAQVEDASSLLALLQKVVEETDFIIQDKALTLDEMIRFLDQQSESINAICLVARLGEEFVGVLNIVPSDHSQDDSIGDIFIAVKQAYWGYGLGSLLMETALDWAKHTPMIHRLELTVQVRNSRAIHLYEKFGFRIDATTSRGVPTKDGEFLDVYLMSRLID